MSYHNVKVTYRMTGKEHLMFGRLQVLHRCTTVSELLRLAVGVLYQLGFEDMPPQDRDSGFACWSARETARSFWEKALKAAEVMVRQSELGMSDKAPEPKKLPAAASSKKKRSPVTI